MIWIIGWYLNVLVTCVRERKKYIHHIHMLFWLFKQNYYIGRAGAETAV